MIVCTFVVVISVIFIFHLEILRFASFRFVLNCGEHTIVYFRRVIPAYYGAFSAFSPTGVARIGRLGGLGVSESHSFVMSSIYLSLWS